MLDRTIEDLIFRLAVAGWTNPSKIVLELWGDQISEDVRRENEREVHNLLVRTEFNNRVQIARKNVKDTVAQAIRDDAMEFYLRMKKIALKRGGDDKVAADVCNKLLDKAGLKPTEKVAFTPSEYLRDLTEYFEEEEKGEETPDSNPS